MALRKVAAALDRHVFFACFRCALIGVATRTWTKRGGVGQSANYFGAPATTRSTVTSGDFTFMKFIEKEHNGEWEEMKHVGSAPQSIIDMDVDPKFPHTEREIGVQIYHKGGREPKVGAKVKLAQFDNSFNCDVQIVNPNNENVRELEATTNNDGIAFFKVRYIAGQNKDWMTFSVTTVNDDGETQGRQITVRIEDMQW